jgi:type IV conjugative transfer system protein TraE
MKPSDISTELEIRVALKKSWQALIAASMLVNILMGIGLVMADRTHRETLVPPEINKTFWIEDKKASGSYIEMMGLFVLRNALDVTTASAEYQMRQILRLTAPNAYGVLEKHLTAQNKRMARDNIATSFAVTGVQIDEAKQSARYTGLLRTMLADKTVAEVMKIYEVVFALSNGRIYLTELRELNEHGQPISASTDDRTQ